MDDRIVGGNRPGSVRTWRAYLMIHMEDRPTGGEEEIVGKRRNNF